MYCIYKYPLNNIPGGNIIEMPEDAQILKLGYDPNGVLCIWAFVQPDLPKKNKTILLAGTGWPFEKEEWMKLHYINTVNDGPYVWHAFEVN